MHHFRSFFQLFWVACCALTMLAQTRLLLGLPLAPGWVDGFVFGGTVFGYHCTHPKPLFRAIAWGMGLLGGICFAQIWWVSDLKLEDSLVFVTPAILWLAYYGFQRPGNSGLRARQVAKPITVALAWAWVTVLLPTPPESWHNLIFLFLGRASFIFSLALAYDISDMAYDKIHGLHTLGSRLGFRRAFLLVGLGYVLAGICFAANLCLKMYEPAQAEAQLLSLAIGIGWLYFLLRKKGWEAWHKVLIDALMMLQFLLVLLFSR